VSHHYSHKQPTRNITLTEDEALALLEICLHTRAEDDATKVRVMDKVGELCREFIKASDQGAIPFSLQTDRSVREALEALSHRRPVPETACA
jgi:hypothetical protein